MQVVINQTHHTIGDFAAIRADLAERLAQKGQSSEASIHLFPELYLCGYPLQDLCVQREFISAYTEHMRLLGEWASEQVTEHPQLFLLGGLDYRFAAATATTTATTPRKDLPSPPESIGNALLAWIPRCGETPQRWEWIYDKRMLPNYDIYEEVKYYRPGDRPGVFEFSGKKLGLLICEDMWSSNRFDSDPVMELKAHGPFDLVICPSASPFHIGKAEQRRRKACEVSQFLQSPFFYLNRVGGEDEILFDGGSFVVSGDELIWRGPDFDSGSAEFKLEDIPRPATEDIPPSRGQTWEDLFSPQLDFSGSLPQLQTMTDADCATTLQALQFGLQEYAVKNGMQSFLVALSGGIDSALVLAIAHSSLRPGQSLEAIYMPSQYSAGLSFDLSHEMCRGLGIKLYSLPIKFLHSAVNLAFRDNFGQGLTGLADENIQSRLRGALLYAWSNQSGAMVINTSNKSELAVGYSTQYGDSVGALSLLGDLYKGEVFQLAQYMNRERTLIPQGIIDRPPSAELRPDQRDDQSLPPYPRLDAMLEGLLSYRMGPTDLVAAGFDPEEVATVAQLYRRAEYKRQQFAPIVKLRPKSFGFGHRIPISKRLPSLENLHKGQ